MIGLSERMARARHVVIDGVVVKDGRATPVAPQQGIGETVAALRKAAGLPAFMVGDVVRMRENENCNAWFVGSTFKVERVDPTEGTFGFTDHDGDRRKRTPSEATLLRPAPCSPAANDNDPPARKFRVGDWVRHNLGWVGEVVEDDGEAEDKLPYRVEWIDGCGEFCSADELEPWALREGDYVRANTGETGRVDAALERFATLDSHVGAFRITDLEPCAAPEPAAEHAYRRGDTVVIVEADMFADGVKNGDVAVVLDAGEDPDILVAPGLRQRTYRRWIRPYTAAAA